MELVDSKYVAIKFGVNSRAVGANAKFLGIEVVRQERDGRYALMYRKSDIDALTGTWDEVLAKAKARAPTVPVVSGGSVVSATVVSPRVDPSAIIAAWKAGVISESEMIQKIKALT